MTGAIQALLCAGVASGGGGGGAVSITGRTVSNTGDGTGTITCGYKLKSDGNAYKTTTVDALLEQWLDSGSASGFDVKATLTSGDTLASGTLGSWLNLGTDRLWSVSAGAGISKSSTLSVQIRDAATLDVLDTATIIVSADNTATGSGGGGGGGAGGGGGTVSITDQTILISRTAGQAYSVSYRLSSDGNAYGTNGLIEAWLQSGAAGDFECRATLQSGGPLSSGTLGTWQALSTDRIWVYSSTASGNATLLIEIRDATSHTVLDSATIQLQLVISGGGGGGGGGL